MSLPRERLKRLLRISVVAMPLLIGCVPTKTYLLPAGEPVRLAEPIRVKVWADLDGDGVMELTGNKIEFQPGWWLVPDIEEGETN